MFKDPATGTYVSELTILTDVRQTAFTCPEVNCTCRSAVDCRGDWARTYLLCSKMTMVKLKQGDKVLIRVLGHHGSMYYSCRPLQVINFKKRKKRNLSCLILVIVIYVKVAIRFDVIIFIIIWLNADKTETPCHNKYGTINLPTAPGKVLIINAAAHHRLMVMVSHTFTISHRFIEDCQLYYNKTNFLLDFWR